MSSHALGNTRPDVVGKAHGRPPQRELAKALGVTERTVQRWVQTDDAPRPVLLALFWLTRWGVHAVHCEAHNAAVMHAQMARSLRDEVEALRSQVQRLASIADFGSANDPAPQVKAVQPVQRTAKTIGTRTADHRRSHRTTKRTKSG